MRRFYAMSILLSLLLFTGCSSTFYSTTGSPFEDDLYGSHDRASIARIKQAEAEAAKAEAEARAAQWQALMAEAEASGVAINNSGNEYSYSGVLADTYESAYARRLNGFRSLSYKMPSSYYELRYSPAYSYVTAYDPMNYNIIVMGDEVWVEPKYISSMFGTWGAPSFSLTIGSGGWYGGFYYDWLWPTGYPYAWWGYPHYSWWDYNHFWYGYGWPYYGPYWPAPMPPHHPGGGGGGGGGKPDTTPHYPNYRPSAGGTTPSGVRPSSPYVSPRGNINYRGGATPSSGDGNYRGTTQTTPATPSSGGNYRGSKGSTTVTQPSGSGRNNRYTGGSSSQERTKGSSMRRDGNSSNSNYRGNSNSSEYRSPNTGYNSGSSYRSSGGGYTGGGSGGGARSGGNYRGGR